MFIQGAALRRWNRRWWWASRVRAFVLLVSIAIALPFLATEPDGPIRLHAEWIRPEAGREMPVVRLDIRPHVPLEDVTLTLATPWDCEVRPLATSGRGEFRVATAVEGRRVIRKDLGSFGAKVRSSHDFELIVSPARNGILEFVVEGRDSDGRKIRGAIGVAVGTGAAAGVQRLGAIEFPATVLSPKENR